MDLGHKTLDFSMIQTHDEFPEAFIWPKDNHFSQNANEILNEPLVDLKGFLEHDKESILHAVTLVKASCLSHGFFQVVNHGVDPSLIALAQGHLWDFFKRPIAEKLKAKSTQQGMTGFACAHSGRFSHKLPWKEILTFEYHENGSDQVAVDFFKSVLGSDFEKTGLIYQKYCQSMKKLSLAILDLLEISLGIDSHNYYRKLYEDSVSIMRCNYYPSCNEPNLTFGVGPHCDPTTLTILHQDQVGGLEVFVDNKWKSVQPRRDALVINIGDTFTALSNGKYKSCLHRVKVNKYKPRISMAFFLCPMGDKELEPPQQLVDKDGIRKYPTFTWSKLLNFTQKHYRADENTLEEFTNWLISSKQTHDA